MSLKQQTQLLKELDKGKDREFRKHYRKDFFMTVDYTVEDQYFQDCIQDMSNSGVFIKTFQPFSIGQTILMTFMVPDHKKSFKINGEIVRVDPSGIGVKFKIESQTQEDVIKALTI